MWLLLSKSESDLSCQWLLGLLCVCALVKTVKFYRRAVMPLPRSMTKYLDEYRKLRNHTIAGDWVFINSINEPYNPSTRSIPCWHGFGGEVDLFAAVGRDVVIAAIYLYLFDTLALPCFPLTCALSQHSGHRLSRRALASTACRRRASARRLCV